jgi:hypothetical protein
MDEVRSNSSLIKSNSFSHLLDFNTEKKYKEPIWNRISKGINCNNEIHLLKPKIIDLMTKKNVTKKIVLNEYKKPFTNEKLNLVFKNNIPIFSNKKFNFKNIKYIKSTRNHIFKGNFNWLINSLSYKNLDTNNSLFNVERAENFLPKILRLNNNSQEHNIKKSKSGTNLYLEKEQNEQNFRITCGMLSSKRLLKERNNKLKINSFMINSAKKYNSLTDEEEEKKSVKDMNKDFTSRNNINNKRKINHFFINRYTKTAMLNNLFQKYTSINNSTNRCNLSENINLSTFNDKNNNEQSKINFIMKLKNKGISHLSERYNNILSKIKKNNSQIININKKIYINCLLSKVGEDLKKEKIFLDKNKKTIFELDKESSYRRIKKIENIITKLYKKNS